MNIEKHLTPQESLEVITSMIREAKGNVQKSSFYFLLWGWTIVIANLGVFILIRFTDVKNPHLIFSITIVSAIISIIYSFRQEKTETAPTHIDTINKWIWIGVGITCFVFVFFGSKIGWQINPIIITMCAMPTFVTGIMLRFKPLMFGGIVLWLFGVASFLVEPDLQFLFAALAVILGYIIPGHMLKNLKQ
ncbi:hypothetical protein BH09BAC3_BH09BAC3_11870 [soil metagenome]